MKRLLAIAALGAVSFALAAIVRGAQHTTPAAARPLPTILTGGVGSIFRVKPPAIIYGTGFAFGRLLHSAFGSRIHWVRYTPTGAKATGTVDHNTCVPACVNGHWTTRPGTITLTRVAAGRFTRMVMTWPGHTSRMRLEPFGHGAWQWG